MHAAANIAKGFRLRGRAVRRRGATPLRQWENPGHDKARAWYEAFVRALRRQVL
jgi:hypothetical protein